MSLLVIRELEIFSRYWHLESFIQSDVSVIQIKTFSYKPAHEGEWTDVCSVSHDSCHYSGEKGRYIAVGNLTPVFN
jgi:hypothetical protein